MKKFTFLLIVLSFYVFSNTVIAQPGCGDTNMGSISPSACSPANASYNAGTIPYWSFSATAGSTYHFTMQPNTEDSYLRIYDAAYVQVASNDDNGPFTSGTAISSISWTCATTGTYYISAAHYSCAVLQNSGNLRFWYTNAPYGAGSGTTLVPTVNWQNHAYTSGSMYWFKFSAQAGRIYDFSLCGNAEDSYIQIYDENWVFQTSIDDNGPHCSGLPASIGWEPIITGNYIIVVRHLGCGAFVNSGDLAYKYSLNCETPGVPVSLSVPSVGIQSADLSWSAGTPPGSANVTYEWQVRNSALNVISDGINPGTTAIVGSLTCGTTYNFRVRAITDCDGTMSAWSDSVVFTTTIVSDPTAVIASPDTLCLGDSTALNASSTGNNIFWYLEQVGGTEIGTSLSDEDFIVTPDSTTTYWAEAQTIVISGAQLTTNFTSNNSYNGNFFDIENVSTSNVNITAFDINTSDVGPYTVHVYYRQNTCVGNTGSSTGWVYVGAHSVTAAGSGNPTNVSLLNTISIPAGQTYGFYLSGNNWNYINGTAVGNSWASDAYLDIKEGYGTDLVNGFGGTLFSPRNFSGTVYYGDLATYNVGPVDASIGASSSGNFTIRSNYFDVLTPSGVTVNSVDIFFTAPIDSTFSIDLIDNIGTVLDSYTGTVTVTGGPAQTVPVNFFVPQGAGYMIIYSLNPGSLRNSDGATYPYTISDVISITGNNWDPLYYYWFYNWSVSAVSPPCISSNRVPVTVTVFDLPAQPSVISGDPDPCVGYEEMYSVLNDSSITYYWTFPAGWSQTGGGNSNEVTVEAGTTGGVISVTPENMCGTGPQSDLTVTVNPLPVVSISGLDTFYCVYYAPVTMIGDPLGGAFTGNGVTGDVFDPASAGVGSHTILYTYTDSASCTNSDSVLVLVDECLSVELMNNGSMQVYPNPVNDLLIVDISVNESATHVWTLYDANGKIVYTGTQNLTTGQNSLQINTSQLASGLYMLHANINGDLYTTRVVKE